MALQMNITGLRRNVKNLAHNYTEPQVKVREATSNDPWGPSSTLMSEIADLTYNVMAFSDIMSMIWKRLNDHGRNWRHVYKALVLLEYLIKTGSEKVAEQCKDNLFAIQTLKDFQYVEENKDQGLNVREKAKAMVSLLKDDERLRNERVRALKAKERFAQSVSGIGSETKQDDAEELTIVCENGKDINSPTSPSYPDTYVRSGARQQQSEPYGVREAAPNNVEFENARPQTIGEEELQLQLALAMSKEEADQEEAKRRSDDVRLQMALTQSQDDFKTVHGAPRPDDKRRTNQSAMNDLLDINFNPNNPGGERRQQQQQNAASLQALLGGSAAMPSAAAQAEDPWGMPAAPAAAAAPQSDPWGSSSADVGGGGGGSRVTSPADPWVPAPTQPELPTSDDPWAPKAAPSPVPVNRDPWGSSSPAPPIVSVPESDPFAPLNASNGDADEFSALSSRPHKASSEDGDLGRLSAEEAMEGLRVAPLLSNEGPHKKSAENFLGENSSLVNLDNLIGGGSAAPAMPPAGVAAAAAAAVITTTTTTAASNPFGQPLPQQNPFLAQQAPKPSMNEMRTQGTLGTLSTGPSTSPTPMAAGGPWNPQAPSGNGGGAPPLNRSNQETPFLL